MSAQSSPGPQQGLAAPPTSVRVLGVDPGLTRCGIGVVDVARNRSATLVDVAVVGTKPHDELDVRLGHIDRQIEAYLSKHRPDVLAVERVFAYDNVSTVMGTAQAMGVVIAAAARHRTAVALLTPTEVKAAVTGNGQAGKDQVTNMVTRILKLDAPPKPADAADALALAIAHAWRGGLGHRQTSTVTPAKAGQSSPAPRRAAGGLTKAQQAWLAAEKNARRNAGQFKSKKG
ncbi:crossover junction endodeoxyribonuclease RuvC [Micrococcoides hystricis]|uniref:Crossover junction endodeoxyribonuclease RuvC n=1 Tax=Micrococcoides hystricis TaxID=1572761 RepID=A0ABV6P7S1_9MICC